MRINKFIAASTGMSRRAADMAIQEGRVLINGQPPQAGQAVEPTDAVHVDGQPVSILQTRTVLFNKPVGYITSRDGQGGRTIYDILPPHLHHLKPVGRLDKQSSGLLLLTNDGDLAQSLTHPRNHKVKIYEVTLYKALHPLHRQMISDMGITLEDGVSKLQLERLMDGDDRQWIVTMHEGRNRQIRRTFESLGYDVKALHRTVFGHYRLHGVRPGGFVEV